MKCIVRISSYYKEKNEKGKTYGFHTHDHVELTDADIESLALKQWKEDHEIQLSDERIYEARLEKTIHD